MIQGGLYNPDKKFNSIATVGNRGSYDLVKCFLENIDALAPEVRCGLKQIAHLYTGDIEETIYRERSIRRGDISDECLTRWEILCENKHYKEYKSLRTAILKWGDSFNLVDKKRRNTRYIEIALLWIHMYVNSRDENLKLSNALFYDPLLPSLNLIEMGNKTEGINYSNDFFNINFPFVFTPPAQRQYFPVDRSLPEVITGIPQLRYDGETLLPPPIEEYEGLHRGYPSVEGYEKFADPSPALIAWNPDETPNWVDFKAQVTKAFEQYLDLYYERTTSYLESAGYQKRKTTTQLEHFTWFVRHQIKQQNVDQIIDECFVQPRALKEAAKETAKLLGLDLRPFDKRPAGRPQGSRDKTPGMRRRVTK